MNSLNYYVKCSHIQVLIGQIGLFDTSKSVIWRVIVSDTQRSKRRSIEILVENEAIEQMNNKTAQQVSEINFWIMFYW
jgi:hypothetical protein